MDEDKSRPSKRNYNKEAFVQEQIEDGIFYEKYCYVGLPSKPKNI